MSLGVMTSGGDAPGMNAAIRAVVRYASHVGIPVHGIYYGYKGLSEGGNSIKGFREADVAQVINRGGTILRSARYPEFENRKERVNALRILKAKYISNLVVIGGDGSFNGAQAIFETNTEEKIIDHLFIVCIPASIDNDIPFTKFSIGTDTALNTAVQCIDKLRDTAYSHRRVFVIQVMGRNCDYLPYMTGISAGASFVIPHDFQFKRRNNNGEIEIDLSELAQRISIGFNIGKDFFMVIVSEGVSETLKKINLKYSSSTPADIIAREIDNELKVNNVSVRPVVLAHVQRGGTPSHFDRLLATRLGVHAIKEILEKVRKYSQPANGKNSPETPDGPGEIEPIMVGLQNAGGNEITKDIIVSVPLKKVLDEIKVKIPNIDPEYKEILGYVTR